MTKVVYLDVVLVGNLIMNYAILWSTAKFAKFNPSRWRLFIGATVGSIYALTIFIPQYYNYLSMAYKLPISMLMIWCTFGSLRWRSFLMGLAYFYVASFGIGGLVFGIMYFMQSAGLNNHYLPDMVNNYFWWGVIGAIILTIIICRFGAQAFHKRTLMQNFKRTVVIKFWGGQVKLQGLVDTGNSLTDPISGLPVMVVEYSALKALLPEEIKAIYNGEQPLDYSLINKLMGDTHDYPRLSIIPYQSIGKEKGLLLGLRPEKVEVKAGNQVLITNEVIVAIHKGTLAVDDGYQALLHPQMGHVA